MRSTVLDEQGRSGLPADAPQPKARGLLAREHERINGPLWPDTCRFQSLQRSNRPDDAQRPVIRPRQGNGIRVRASHHCTCIVHQKELQPSPSSLLHLWHRCRTPTCAMRRSTASDRHLSSRLPEQGQTRSQYMHTCAAAACHAPIYVAHGIFPDGQPSVPHQLLHIPAQCMPASAAHSLHSSQTPAGLSSPI